MSSCLQVTHFSGTGSLPKAFTKWSSGIAGVKYYIEPYELSCRFMGKLSQIMDLRRRGLDTKVNCTLLCAHFLVIC